MSKIMKNEGLYVAILATVVIVVGVLGTLAARQAPEVEQVNTTSPPTAPGKPEPPLVEDAFISQESCEAAGGTFDECGSACRGAGPDAVCILMCVQYCYCASDAQCPDGYSCGDYINGEGICQKSQ